MSDLDVLWEPVHIGPATAPNRIAVPAHQTHFPMEADDLIGARYIAYMEARARGGAGLLVVEAGAVHPSAARDGLINAYRPEIVPGMRRLGEAIHRHESLLFAQLSHMGNQDPGTSVLDEWHPLVAPSPIPSVVYGRIPKALAAEEIASIVAGYGQTAANAREAGLDGAEISAGHGYLVCQFLSPLTNRRTDEYGGSLENRCRFAVEAAEEVRRCAGEDFALGIRLSFDEGLGDAGLTPEESEGIVRLLDGTGLFDYFSITGGNYHTAHEWVPGMASGYDGNFVPDAERAKGAVGSGAPVVVASAIRTVERAAEIVGGGQADLVGMARAHIADPDLVAKARAGRGGEIRRCVGANQGCLRRLFEHGMITCTVNPAAGRERTLGGTGPPAERRRVAVVGGGPAGMKLAETAAERGHQVVLLERAGVLGGQLLLAGRLPGRENWLELAASLERSIGRLGVDVRLGTVATAEVLAGIGADEVVLATGSRFDLSGYSISSPGRDTIPGIERDGVIAPDQAIADPEGCGDRVVIFDDNGDHVPLSLALLLAEPGRSVEVVSSQLFAGSRLVVTGDLPWLLPKLASAGVPVTSQFSLDGMDADSVAVSSIWGGGPRRIPADTVILSMMRVAEDSLVAELAGSGMAVTRLGDCLAPREVDDATYEAVLLGRTIGVESGAPA